MKAKQIGWGLACCYGLLLLMPLPAISRRGDELFTSDVPSHVSSHTPSDSSVPPSTNGEEMTDFRVLDTETGKIHTFSDRDFVFYTIAAELYPTFHEEAFKAQAVATYTYYSFERRQQRLSPDADLGEADFSDVPSTFPASYSEEGLRERWGKQFDKYYEKISRAVDEVFGERLWYNGSLARAVYHAISNGTTETAEVMWGAAYPYLISVASPGDRSASGYEQVKVFTDDEMKQALAAETAVKGDPETWFSDIVRSEAGTVISARVGEKELTGSRLRRLLGLRSASFSLSYDEHFTVTVHGYGHGVGMSQCGADSLAQAGMTYREILAYYYPGTEVSQ